MASCSERAEWNLALGTEAEEQRAVADRRADTAATRAAGFRRVLPREGGRMSWRRLLLSAWGAIWLNRRRDCCQTGTEPACRYVHRPAVGLYNSHSLLTRHYAHAGRVAALCATPCTPYEIQLGQTCAMLGLGKVRSIGQCSVPCTAHLAVVGTNGKTCVLAGACGS